MTLRDIEYGVGHAPLEELLLSVNRPGDFCAHGRLFVALAEETGSRAALTTRANGGRAF